MTHSSPRQRKRKCYDVCTGNHSGGGRGSNHARSRYRSIPGRDKKYLLDGSTLANAAKGHILNMSCLLFVCCCLFFERFGGQGASACSSSEVSAAEGLNETLTLHSATAHREQSCRGRATQECALCMFSKLARPLSLSLPLPRALTRSAMCGGGVTCRCRESQRHRERERKP